MVVLIPRAFKGYFDNVLKRLLNRNWLRLPEIHVPSATYKETKDCHVNAKKKIYLWRLRVKLLQDKILQNVPEHTYIEGFEKNWGGRMPSSHSESDICASPRHLSQSLKM